MALRSVPLTHTEEEKRLYVTYLLDLKPAVGVVYVPDVIVFFLEELLCGQFRREIS